MELEMNERIEKLAEQAEKYADANFKGEPFWTQAYESKFAELIVRECVDIADEYDGVGSTIVSRIRKHFGVEK
jgi:hypothetical protein